MFRTSFFMMFWFEFCLIPVLPPNCTAVLDNAPFHNKKVKQNPTINGLRVAGYWALFRGKEI